MVAVPRLPKTAVDYSSININSSCENVVVVVCMCVREGKILTLYSVGSYIFLAPGYSYVNR